MKNRALVTVVSGLDTLDGNKPDTITLTTQGTFEEADGVYKLFYSEQSEDGVTETEVTVFSPTHIQVSREGVNCFLLDADLGKRYIGIYNTPYGELDMGIYPSEVRALFSDGGAKLHMKYTVDFNAQLASENTIDITVKQI